MAIISRFFVLMFFDLGHDLFQRPNTSHGLL